MKVVENSKDDYIVEADSCNMGDVGWSYEDRTNQFEYKDDSSNKQRFLHAKNGSDDVATMYKCNIDTRSQKWRKNQKVQLRAMTLFFLRGTE